MNIVTRQPLVSVIVPNYNHYGYLKERLDSVYHQTYPNFEVILLDDCSTDNSVTILETYKSNPTTKQFVVNNHNSGSTFKQWRKGVSLCSGEYIWIAESDDSASPYFIEKMIHAVTADNTSMVFCSNHIIDSDGKVLQDFGVNFTEPFYNGDSFIKKHLYTDCDIRNVSGVIFKKECLEKALGTDIENFALTGDWLVYVRVALQGRVVFLNEYLNHFRRHLLTVRSRSIAEGKWLTEGILVQAEIEKHLDISMELRLHLSNVLYRRFVKYLNQFDQKYQFKIFQKISSRLTFFQLFKTAYYLLRQKLRFKKQLIFLF
jgi:glycosyltransferase involved in cell wall biosynthesis